ncbi:MAG: L-arabinose isomerase [Eubacteriales bacterium]
MRQLDSYYFSFIVGSQDLYGPETLRLVEKNSREIVDSMNSSGSLPWEIRFSSVVIDSNAILDAMEKANSDKNCAGVIVWMHTFSPAKMWIAGLKALRLPLLHLHTQYNKEIPVNEIDMDYMNLHQSAHGDREFGYICARLRLARKVVTGHYTNSAVLNEVDLWMRAAIGFAVSRELKCERFGDNMRQVAVTEGDKVEAQIKLGWEVNYLPVGELVAEIDKVTDEEVTEIFNEFNSKYTIDTDDLDAVHYQARIEIAMKKLFEKRDSIAFSTNFEDLYGLKQLPGLAVQRLMGDGFGFAGEGDWKTACLQAVMKRMEAGLQGGSAFMEDYTYHLSDDSLVLGAHMLEVDPSIATGEIKISVEPLGIGNRMPPARMKFVSRTGNAICVSLVDMGDRLRMICADVEVVDPVAEMPNLPVAQVMWRPLPDLKTSSEAWIYAGGAHHTVLSLSLTAEHMRQFAEMVGIEFVHIGADTDINTFRENLLAADVVWRNK